MTNLISIRAASKEIGVSHTAIQKAIKEGRIRDCVVIEDGRKMIDLDLLKAEWHSQQQNNVRRGAVLYASPIDQASAALDHANEEADDYSDSGASYLKHRAHREAYAAKLAQLSFEEKSGRLIEADEVKKQAFATARIVRDSILNIPDRIAAELAAESNQFKVHKMLLEEIRKALSSLTELDEV